MIQTADCNLPTADWFSGYFTKCAPVCLLFFAIINFRSFGTRHKAGFAH